MGYNNHPTRVYLVPGNRIGGQTLTPHLINEGETHACYTRDRAPLGLTANNAELATTNIG